MSLRAVIACCARDCASALPAALANIERIAALYEEAAFVFVENDSADDTAGLLKHWMAGRTNAQLIRLDGLHLTAPERTVRLAACRNAYMQAIRTSGLAGFDHLVVIDSDDVNERPIDPADLARARDWLSERDDVAAVFCNSTPIYYDILALRHPTWCPDDFWAEVRRHAADIGKAEANARFWRQRQIPIAREASPIEVQSAFGGLGLYKLRHALGAEYVGLNAEGYKTCEHVAFNEAVARAGRGKLYILPWLETGRTTGLGAPLPDLRKLELEQSGKSCSLNAPADHPLDRYRAKNPLYDRRLPLVAKLVSDAAPRSVMIDVGANIGDSIALCRLAGCALRVVAIEASLTYLKYLLLNRIKRPALFEGVDPVWAMVGSDPDAAIELHDGTARIAKSKVEGSRIERAPVMTLEAIAGARGLAPRDISLVKIDTDGQDQTIILAELDYLKSAAPVLWAEADISNAAHEAAWARILSEGADVWPYLVVFDNFGFAYAAGRTAEKAGSFLDLISYARRHKATPAKAFGPPTVYYADVALFPERFAGVFEAFTGALPELDR